MRLRDLTAVAAGGALLAVAGGCSLSENEADIIAGKEKFVEHCSSCHTLARAGAKGTQGPDLDQAFKQALASGMKRSGIEGAVHEQILNPARVPKDKTDIYMPAKLVEGDEARNVAAYVAEVAARGGEDTGLLAEAGKPEGGGEPAVAEDGVLTIEATPQLAYVTGEAQAPPGPLTVRSPNPSGTPHNIALEGPGGVNEIGEVVQDGGISEVEATVQAGEYAFFCTVPGHREGGMEGVLTVER